MRRILTTAVVAIAALSSSASAQAGGTVQLTDFLQAALFTNTGTSALTQFVYSLGPKGNNVATWQIATVGGVASDFLSDPQWFQTITWSGLNILPGQTRKFGDVNVADLDIDLITTLAPLSIDEGTITGGLQNAFVRATFANGQTLQASLFNGDWVPTQNLVLGSTAVVVTTPEPATLPLIAAGFVAVVYLKRKRRL